MATNPFEEQLQCPVCTERYETPKILPCQHTFCLQCLERWSESRNDVSCPECRAVHPVPEGGISGFPNSIVILRFLEVAIPANVPSSVLRSEQNAPVHRTSNERRNADREVQFNRISNSTSGVMLTPTAPPLSFQDSTVTEQFRGQINEEEELQLALEISNVEELRTREQAMVQLASVMSVEDERRRRELENQATRRGQPSTIQRQEMIHDYIENDRDQGFEYQPALERRPSGYAFHARQYERPRTRNNTYSRRGHGIQADRNDPSFEYQPALEQRPSGYASDARQYDRPRTRDNTYSRRGHGTQAGRYVTGDVEHQHALDRNVGVTLNSRGREYPANTLQQRGRTPSHITASEVTSSARWVCRLSALKKVRSNMVKISNNHKKSLMAFIIINAVITTSRLCAGFEGLYSECPSERTLAIYFTTSALLAAPYWPIVGFWILTGYLRKALDKECIQMCLSLDLLMTFMLSVSGTIMLITNFDDIVTKCSTFDQEWNVFFISFVTLLKGIDCIVIVVWSVFYVVCSSRE